MFFLWYEGFHDETEAFELRFREARLALDILLEIQHPNYLAEKQETRTKLAGLEEIYNIELACIEQLRFVIRWQFTGLENPKLRSLACFKPAFTSPTGCPQSNGQENVLVTVLVLVIYLQKMLVPRHGGRGFNNENTKRHGFAGTEVCP
jgi:hypothetical protein